MKSAFLPLSLCVLSLPGMLAQCWEKPDDKWTEMAARRVMTDSPWAKQSASPRVIVRWESAAPVVHARRVVKLTPLEGDGVAVYRISIAGLAPDAGGSATASLRYSGGEAVNMSRVRVMKDADGSTLAVFEFPRAEGVRDPGLLRVLPFGIRLRANEFRFAATVGPAQVRQIFDLRQMICRRELAL